MSYSPRRVGSPSFLAPGSCLPLLFVMGGEAGSPFTVKGGGGGGGARSRLWSAFPHGMTRAMSTGSSGDQTEFHAYRTFSFMSLKTPLGL